MGARSIFLFNDNWFCFFFLILIHVFSATWPLGVRRLAQSYMVNPIQIHVGSLDLAAVHSVTQTIIMMGDDDQEKYYTVHKSLNVSY